jgi:hypothetical protein
MARLIYASLAWAHGGLMGYYSREAGKILKLLARLVLANSRLRAAY